MYTKEELFFTSKGTKCSAWLYRPKSIKNPPIVIMAHGFGAQKIFGLPEYAKHFAKQGMAVFLFDYRCIGESEGEPRNLVNPYRHCSDWESAIEYVKKIDTIDKNRIALWGSSFSGGHVLYTAARHPEIAAVISQVPHIDSLTTPLMTGLKYTLQCYFYGFIDLFKMITFQQPYYIPIIAPPDKFACMNSHDSMDGFMSLVPEGAVFDNRCPARVAFTSSLYRPTTKASKIKCPVLVFHARDDSLIYTQAVQKAVKKMKQGRLIEMPIKHFEIYTGEPFKETIKLQIDFFKKNLI
ncbi:MAG: alpha/beta hydrolase [bacterium]|nr:alpha/beta hydrolase [bacterium]